MSAPSPPLLTLTRLMLRDFRSYPALTLGVDSRVVVLAGENGTGKTNLLEAVSLLGPGRGLRGAKLADLARITPEGRLPWAAAGRFRGPWGEFDIGTGTPEGGPVERRSFRLDGQPVRGSADLADRVAAVWLTPQMDRLFQDGAGERRRFLDRLVWALEPGHARQVAAYDRAMTQRNRLLAGGGLSRADPGWLSALEDAMARHGVALAAARRSLVSRLNLALAEGVTGAFPVALPGADLFGGGGARCSAGAGGGGPAAGGMGASASPRRGCRNHPRRAAPRRPRRDPRLEGRAGGAVLHGGAEGAAGLDHPRPCGADRGGAGVWSALAAGRGGRAPGCAAARGAVHRLGGAPRAGVPDRHRSRGLRAPSAGSPRASAPPLVASFRSAIFPCRERPESLYWRRPPAATFQGVSRRHEQGCRARRGRPDRCRRRGRGGRLQQRVHHCPEGPRRRPQAARHVHRRHRRRLGPAPHGLRDHRQRGRRGAGRLRHAGARSR